MASKTRPAHPRPAHREGSHHRVTRRRCSGFRAASPATRAAPRPSLCPRNPHTACKSRAEEGLPKRPSSDWNSNWPSPRSSDFRACSPLRSHSGPQPGPTWQGPALGRAQRCTTCPAETQNVPSGRLPPVGSASVSSSRPGSSFPSLPVLRAGLRIPDMAMVHCEYVCTNPASWLTRRSTTAQPLTVSCTARAGRRNAPGGTPGPDGVGRTKPELQLPRSSARGGGGGSSSSSSYAPPPPALALAAAASSPRPPPPAARASSSREARGGLPPPGPTGGPRSPESEGYPATSSPAMHPNRTPDSESLAQPRCPWRSS